MIETNEDRRARLARNRKRYYYRHLETMRVKARTYKATSPSAHWSVVKRNAMKRRVPFLITNQEFRDWYARTPPSCVYCGLPKQLSERWTGQRLQIDRVNPYKLYAIGNISFACAVCNQIKAKFFTADETKEIIGLIRPVLASRIERLKRDGWPEKPGKRISQGG